MSDTGAITDRTRALLNSRDIREKYFANVQRRERSAAYESIYLTHGYKLAAMYEDWAQNEDQTA